jgi:hypothetical protein
MTMLLRPAGILLLAGFFSSLLLAQTNNDNSESWAYDSLHIPGTGSASIQKKPVIVAVVDDAFRLSHNELKNFIHKNPIEIPGNQHDDDGNNYADDLYGWDISDNDKDVSHPEGLSQVYYHGTYIASLITRVASLHYGKEASEKIKIMPVKVLSDQASRTYIRDGYKGIRYAMENGADIICIAWSGGNPGPEDLEIIHEANRRGILLIGSAGNLNEEHVQYPASDPAVLAVAGLNRTFGKEEYSSYGMEVDLAAPAENVQGAHPEKDNAYIKDMGTSAAAALVTGCAAVILSHDDNLSSADIRDALINASTPYDFHFNTYGGKMGAGVLNLENALKYASSTQNPSVHFSSLRSKGSIIINSENKEQSFSVHPAGGYQGFYLEPDITKLRKPNKYSFSITVNDTTWNEFYLSNSPSQLFVPSPSWSVQLHTSAFRKKDVFRINYYGKTIDSTRLFCRGTRYLTLESGSIEDGSREENYANNCSCRWIITVPPGKRIKFTFDKMDTQANIDYVYLVDGRTAIPENFIAKFSGQNIPPVVVSRSNEVLVWFVTDQNLTGRGWHFHYQAVE